MVSRTCEVECADVLSSHTHVSGQRPGMLEGIVKMDLVVVNMIASDSAEGALLYSLANLAFLVYVATRIISLTIV